MIVIFAFVFFRTCNVKNHFRFQTCRNKTHTGRMRAVHFRLSDHVNINLTVVLRLLGTRLVNSVGGVSRLD